jgi:putative aldouronate transport system substrate-binding protein
MRITRRKAAAGIAAASALAVTLTACSSGPSDEGDAAEQIDLASQVGYMEDYGVGTTFKATEPVEFSLLYRDHPDYPYNAQWPFLQHLEENQNVTFDPVNVPLADLQTRRSVLISSGDAPEIMPSIYAGDETQFVAGGALLPISDYVDEYMPNFTDKIEKWDLQDEVDQLRQADGKYYLLPGIHEIAKPQYSIAIRKDVWEAAGLTQDPKTWDEFKEQLEVIKAANPDAAYPYTDKWSINSPMEQTLNAAAPNFGTSAGEGYGNGLTWNEDGTEARYTGATDEYRQLLEYFHSLVADGLMDPESVTQEMAEGEEKFASGQALSIASNDQELVKYRANFESQGNTEAEVHQIVVPAGPAGNNLAGGTRRESGIVFSSEAAKSDHFVAMLQFVDWLYYSDEGLEFAKWGVEGETYTKDADGKRTLMPEIDVNGLNPGAPKELRRDFGYHNGVWMLAHGSTQDLDLSMLRPEVIDFIEGMNEKEELPLPPAVPFDEMEQEQASLLQTTLGDIVNQNTAAFILGQRSFDEWDAYVAELEAAGSTQYVELATKAVNRAAEGGQGAEG